MQDTCSGEESENPFEVEREKNIQHNLARLRALGLLKSGEEKQYVL